MPKKTIKKILFWLFQIIGWSFFGLNSWLKIFNSDLNASSLYFIIEGLNIVIPGILCSTVYRNYLKKIKFIENQTIKHYKKIIIPIFLCVLTISIFSHFVSDYAYEIIEGKPIEWSFLQDLSLAFNITFLMFIWTIFYTVVNVILKNQKDKINNAKLLAELKESQLNTLKGQINPHFMFNSLNNIRGLMLEDVYKSREMLTCLSEMLRSSLNMNKQDSIPLSEEIETVENYIALSKIQFEDRLVFEKEIDKSLLEIEIPPMLLQMLIENGIKHGLGNQKKGGRIKLLASQNETNFIFKVINTGRLVVDKNSTKIGLENIKKRLDLLYENSASFSLEEINGNVHATINIPKEK